MLFRRFFRRLPIIVLASYAGGAGAQEIYAGSLYETGSGALTAGESVDTAIQSFVGLAGVRFPVRGPIYAGGEIETAFNADYTLKGERGSGTDNTLRYRGVAGVEISGFSVFLSAGQSLLATETERYSGASVGIGVEMPVGESVSLRVEAIRDAMSDADNVAEIDTQSIRAGATINF